jgi:hypothetical protein
VSQSYEIRLKQYQLRDLETDLEGLGADSEALSKQLNSTTNAVDRRRIEQQRCEIYVEMEGKAKQYDALRQETDRLLQQENNQQPFNDLPGADLVLWNILSPYESRQGLSPVLERAYRLSACLEDFPRYIPTSLKGKLTDLGNMQLDRFGYSPLIKFVAHLVSDRQLPEPLSEQLTAWAEQQTQEFSSLLGQVKQSVIVSQKSVQSFLMVVVERSLSTDQQKGDRYTVKAWFIADELRYDRRSGSGSEPLGAWGETERTFAKSELEPLLHSLLDESGKRHLLKDLTIELFLPAELLNEPVEAWGLDEESDLDEPIGCRHRFIIRSSDRLQSMYFSQYGGSWQTKWGEMPKPGERQAMDTLLFGDDTDPKAISQKLKQPKVLGLKFAKEPLRVGKNSTFAALKLAASPVAIWLRQPLSDVDEAAIDQLLSCCLHELPQIVKQQRQLAFSEDPDSHMGHHLALLWESFDRLPPDVDFPYEMA